MSKISVSFRPFLLAMLMILFVTATMSGQNTVGKFTLPLAVDWAGAAIPAGDYSFTLDPTGVHWMELRNAEKTYFLRFAYKGDLPGAAKSQLSIIAPEGSKPAVRSLYLANRETAFFFNVPPEYIVSHRIRYVPVDLPPNG